MFADLIPTEHNAHGLYCNAVDPSGLMLSTWRYYNRGDVQGIIECRGKVVQHTDGVMRVEWARILCLIVLGDGEGVYSPNYVRMRDRYFPIPVYVMTSAQYAELLFRLLVLNRSRENGGE